MKLENTMVIVADLGALKVYQVKKHEGMVDKNLKESYALSLVNERDYINAHQKVSDVLSDQTGSFKGSNGDEHNRESEQKKRSIKDIAKDIDSVVESQNPKQLFLAFPKELLSKLCDELGHQTKAILTKTSVGNLVKIDKNKILSHFL